MIYSKKKKKYNWGNHLISQSDIKEDIIKHCRGKPNEKKNIQPKLSKRIVVVKKNLLPEVLQQRYHGFSGNNREIFENIFSGSFQSFPSV